MHPADIPKVELHCHLEACFRPETAHEIARDLGLNPPDRLVDFKDNWLITKPQPNLESALQRFINIQKLWASKEIIERLTFEACEYAVSQNIKVLELRYAPNFIQGANDRLSFDEIHQAILSGLERASPLDLAVGVIGIVQKTLTDQQAAYTGDFIIEHHQSFVGMDFADQDGGDVFDRFVSMTERARAVGLGVTVHAGEEPGPGASRQVRAAIDQLGATRIGHGIHVIDDPKTMDFLQERDVLLEICPTSNWLTSSVNATANHPIRQLMEYGVAVSINSDDPGIFDIDLCHEYHLLQDEHGFDEADFRRCNSDAFAKSFIDTQVKSRFWAEPDEGTG